MALAFTVADSEASAQLSGSTLGSHPALLLDAFPRLLVDFYTKTQSLSA